MVGVVVYVRVYRNIRTLKAYLSVLILYVRVKGKTENERGKKEEKIISFFP